jgi:hypothetical protein
VAKASKRKIPKTGSQILFNTTIDAIRIEPRSLGQRSGCTTQPHPGSSPHERKFGFLFFFNVVGASPTAFCSNKNNILFTCFG